MTQILSQPDSGGHGQGQWRRKTQAVATQITGRGDAKHRQGRLTTRAEATQNIGSGDTNHAHWRRKIRAVATRALATQNTGSGETTHEQWQHKSRALATQNTGSGDTNHAHWRRKTRAVATQNTGSGDTKHGHWRHKTRAMATQNMGSGDTKHGQWRRKTRDPMFQEGLQTGRGVGVSSTLHRTMNCTSQIHTVERYINSVLLDVLTVVNILGLTPYSLVGSILTNIPTLSSTPKMKAICSSEALMLSHQAPGRHNSKHRNVRT
jgi:hypothetical protein